MLTVLAAIFGIAIVSMFAIDFALGMGKWEENIGARIGLYAVLIVAIPLLFKGSPRRNKYIPERITKERAEKKINKYMYTSLVGVLFGFILHANYLA